MPENFKLGMYGVTYYADAPLLGRPDDTPAPTVHFNNAVWHELDNVQDVNLDGDSEKVDTTTRSEAKKGWASQVATTKNGQITTTIRWKPGDAAFDKIVRAWIFNKEIAILDLDGAKNAAGSQGLVGNFTVSFGIKRPVKGIMAVDVTFTLSSYPDWVVVNAGGTAMDELTDT